MSHLGEVLLLGNERAGKTLLCRQLENYCTPRDKRTPVQPVNPLTQPSVGVELLHLEHQRKAFSVREVGGAMQPVWPLYFEGCHVVVFVVDTSSTAAVSAAAIEWYNLLSCPALKHKPLLLLLNKSDSPTALSSEMLELALRFKECEALHSSERHIGHLHVSALTGDGMLPLLDWATNAFSIATNKI